MDKHRSDWQKLKCYMETEKILLTSYTEKNRVLRETVRHMNWPALEIQLRDLNDLSGQIDEIDKRRNRIYQRIRKNGSFPKEADFFLVSGELAGEFRDEIRQLHNHLKIITDRVKVESRVTSAYVESRNLSLKQMLGDLIPETKNLFYSPRGKIFTGNTGTTSLLVNRHF